MRDEESDDSDVAPLPPHERAWRHPAERAAAERVMFESISTPPPLSRRSRLVLTGFAGAVAVLLVFVSVPIGIGAHVDNASDTTTSDSTPVSTIPIKGLTGVPAIVVAGSHGSTTALAVGNGTLITSLEEVTSRDDVWVTLPSGADINGRVAAADADSGIALVRVDDAAMPELSKFTISFAASPGDDLLSRRDAMSRLKLIDWLGAQQAEFDDGLTTSTDNVRRIVRTPREIAGVAAVTTRKGAIVGIAVRRAQATWVFSLADLKDILATAFGISNS